MKTVDLFAGCGGLSMGFENAEFEIVAAFEYWGTAANCYELNFTHPVYTTDLSDVSTAVRQIQEYKPELIIGGPPCQDFSHAGKRVEAKRAGLTEAFAEIIRRIRPRLFVMENVDRAEKSRAYAHARSTFKGTGYGLTEVVLDASHCGVPQKRKRFFCIGILDEGDGVVRKNLEEHQTDSGTTLRDYFGDKLGFEYYYRHPRNYSRRSVFSVDEPAPTIRGVNRPIPKGYPGHPNDACPISDKVHVLTTRERALIQTFPEDFILEGSKTDMEQMVGNAVPVKLAEYVARAVIEYMQEKDQVGWIPEFQEWLIVGKGYSVKGAKDVISRLKRAERIIPSVGEPDKYYIYKLDQHPGFQSLSVDVRSQIKKAIQLRMEFEKTMKAA